MTTTHGLSRFAADLPLVTEFVSLGEGNTPLISLDRLAVRLGLKKLSAKMECLNPTGSYKDRVAAMSLSLARTQGARGWIATSSGNAGLAMAAYGARAGVAGFLCLVASAPVEKRLPLVPYDVGVAIIKGDGGLGLGTHGARLMEEVRSAALRHQLFLGITANSFNPEGMRGIDTIGYELAEQCPDTSHVYVPTGGGGLLTSISRGLATRGVSARVIACQPAGCAPIVQFISGEISSPKIGQCDSTISALQLPAPPDGTLAATAVAASAGWGTAVPDNAILSAQRLLASTEGIFVEPASATALAALSHDIERGRVAADEHPVLIMTGAGWKDLGRYAADITTMPLIDVADVSTQVQNWLTHSTERGPDDSDSARRSHPA